MGKSLKKSGVKKPTVPITTKGLKNFDPLKNRETVGKTVKGKH